MTKAELIDLIARSRDLPPELTKKDIAKILNIAFEELADYFARAKVTRAQTPRFTFPHFGTFTKKRRSARKGVNPRTLEPMQIEAFDTVDFNPSRELRESMNGSAKGESGARARRTKTTRGGKRTTKRTAARKGGSLVGSRRRLTPRDEDETVPRSAADDERFAALHELPPARMQRVEEPEPERPRRRARRSS